MLPVKRKARPGASPVSMLSSVVLPAPDGPIIASTSPVLASALTWDSRRPPLLASDACCSDTSLIWRCTSASAVFKCSPRSLDVALDLARMPGSISGAGALVPRPSVAALSPAVLTAEESTGGSCSSCGSCKAQSSGGSGVMRCTE